jgi:hypothetical protein
VASAAFASTAAGASAAFSTLAATAFFAVAALLTFFAAGAAKTIAAEIIVASRIFFIVQSSWKMNFFVSLSKIIHLL